ncbi:hypothetical protein [Hippea jasoniae]|uniref:hypothetical protein n=1 Tax=Hippea jasoniae TaxID=944479 RepID=UPI0005597DEC|nr:hypothetical protein [Hippea jasoniae]
MKCEIDVIIDRKNRWTIKEKLSESGIQIKEWFIEFSSNNTIVSFEVDDGDTEKLKDIFELLKNSSSSRIILPDGKRINPLKEEFESFFKEVCNYIGQE